MHKKIFLTSWLALCCMGLQISWAGSIGRLKAEKVAAQLYHQYCEKAIDQLQLAYSAVSTSGDTLLYAFNVNAADGFIVLAGDDALRPLVGYATAGRFAPPVPASPLYGWLEKRKKEVAMAKEAGLVPSTAISREWSLSNTFKSKPKGALGGKSVTPLLKSIWDQKPFFNDSCPSGVGSNSGLAVTGCVATAMAQIMKYWSYPAQGIGYASYCDCLSDNFSNNYGTLHANFGATTYNWQDMPDTLDTDNAAVAQLLYHCGVAVDMDYGADGSGAWVIGLDASGYGCAQTALSQYFKYDSVTMHGVYRQSYSDSAWVALILNDLVKGRPVEYVADSGGNNGHTWVCDGYDANSGLFHMNWGWGGYANGYYDINNLAAGGYSFVSDHELLYGILPVKAEKPSTDFTSVQQVSCGAGSINYLDQSSNRANAWNWYFPGGTPATSHEQNPTVSYAKAGRYSVALVASNNYGKGDSIVKTNFVQIDSGLLAVTNVCQPQTATLTGVDYASGIYNFTLNSINNNSGSAIQDGGYRDFSCIAHTELKPNTNYNFSITVSSVESSAIAIYIDYNNNGSFADAGELIYATDSTSAATVTGTFKTPTQPVMGQYLRLRAITDYSSITDACESGNPGDEVMYGQAEDYAVLFSNTASGIASIDNGSEASMHLFPNPANDEVHVQLESETYSPNNTLDFFDITGRLVKTIAGLSMNAGSNNFVCNVSDLSSGMYLLRLINSSGAYTQKIQINH